MCGVLCDVMAAFTDWQYRHGLFSTDPYPLAKHDAPVAEEDVWHQGEWPTWLILLEPTVVTFDYNSLALEFIVTQLLSWRKLLWHEERQVAARLDGSIDAGRCRLNEEGASEIAFGIDAFGVHRPQWSQLCGHGPDSTDVVFDRAVVGNVDAAAWVADGRLKAKPESPRFIDGVGNCPNEKDNGGDRNGNGADDRSPTDNCIQHDRPVRLEECKPAVALVACVGCYCRWPVWRHRVRLTSCSGSIIVGRLACQSWASVVCADRTLVTVRYTIAVYSAFHRPSWTDSTIPSIKGDVSSTWLVLPPTGSTSEKKVSSSF